MQKLKGGKMKSAKEMLVKYLDCKFCGHPASAPIRTCCEQGKEEDSKKNWKNKAQCGNCKDIIESKYHYDFVSCSCGDIFVDGGDSYWRAGCKNGENFIRIWEEK
jgi:hypothetical protein